MGAGVRVGGGRGVVAAVGLAAAMLLALPTAAVAADLTVVVDGVRSPTGAVVIGLNDSVAQWDDKASAVATARVEVHGDRVVHVFHGVAPGTYAVGVFHDENGNGKLDTNLLGIPKESCGFSNNPKILRKAHFDEASFAMASDDLTVTIHLMHVL